MGKKKIVGWLNEPKSIKNWYGFVYEIINNINHKRYIGKKFFWKKKTLSPLKGRKNKRHKKVESDWKSYWGSCKELLEDIRKYGEENFTRRILLLCKDKWECAYYEAKLQFENNVLLDKTWYNGIINCRLSKRK